MEEGSSDDDDFMEQEARLLQEAEFEPVKRVIWLSNDEIDDKIDFKLPSLYQKLTSFAISILLKTITPFKFSDCKPRKYFFNFSCSKQMQIISN